MKHAASLLCVVYLFSCTEDIDTSARYVFDQPTVISYLQKFPDTYSDYLAMLFKVKVSQISQSTVGQLLTARGHYTVFAPTNQAIKAYLETLVEQELIADPSWEAFTDSIKLDSIRKVIVFNSIIDSGDDDPCYETSNFPASSGHEFPLANMYGNKFTVTFELSGEMLINGTYPINKKNYDIRVLNGIIHQMDTVIAPNLITARKFIQDIIDNKKRPYLVMSRAIQACGLMDTLSAIKDERYELMYQQGKIEDLPSMMAAGFHEGPTAYVPEHRKYGFTIFAETDTFWESQGIDPEAPDLLTKLQEWVNSQQQYSSTDHFTLGNDYTDEDNLLYQWVTYHILPMKIPANKLVFHHNELGYDLKARTLGIPVCDYHITMGKRRLMKLYESKASCGIFINRFPQLDNGRRGTNQELSCDADKKGSRIGTESDHALLSDMINCNIYPIEEPIAYTDNTRSNLKKERIRYDGMSIFPEALNNDIRKKGSTADRYQYVYIPKTSVYQYFDDLWINDDCNFVYYNAYGYDWRNLNADETKAVGRYEITFRLPPVPASGVYELRYGLNPTSYRGIAQIYFGSDLNNMPAKNIPIDLTSENLVDRTGYEDDSEDIIYNAEIDKRMRLHGYMKAPYSNCALGDAAQSARALVTPGSSICRYIVLRETLDPEKTYYIKFRSILDQEKKEFQLDYFEWCAKEVYDNPDTPEDIW